MTQRARRASRRFARQPRPPPDERARPHRTSATLFAPAQGRRMREVRGIATAIALTLLVAVALVVNASLTASNVREVADADARVSHAHEVLETLQGVLSSLQDAETGQRGFIITGETPYLAPYYAGRKAVLRRLNRL